MCRGSFFVLWFYFSWSGVINCHMDVVVGEWVRWEWGLTGFGVGQWRAYPRLKPPFLGVRERAKPEGLAYLDARCSVCIPWLVVGWESGSRFARMTHSCKERMNGAPNVSAGFYVWPPAPTPGGLHSHPSQKREGWGTRAFVVSRDLGWWTPTQKRTSAAEAASQTSPCAARLKPCP